jgi:hypothetical protein
MKIIKVEITRCNQCPHWSMGVCTKEGQPISGMHYPPDWCPLEDAPNNKCTCERCTGLAVDSYYVDEIDTGSVP